MLEEWRDIPSLPGVQASSHGRLRVVPYWSEAAGRRYGGEITIGQWDGARYIYRIRKRTYKVARLVCEAFYGPAPADRQYCLHGDEDSRNNHATNLSWGTQKENLNAPGFVGYCKSRTGENNPFIKGRRKALAASEGGLF